MKNRKGMKHPEGWHQNRDESENKVPFYFWKSKTYVPQGFD